MGALLSLSICFLHNTRSSRDRAVVFFFRQIDFPGQSRRWMGPKDAWPQTSRTCSLVSELRTSSAPFHSSLSLDRSEIESPGIDKSALLAFYSSTSAASCECGAEGTFAPSHQEGLTHNTPSPHIRSIITLRSAQGRRGTCETFDWFDELLLCCW